MLGLLRELYRGVVSLETVPLKELKVLEGELQAHLALKKGNEPVKILFAHSLSIYPPSFIHDRILSMALRLRGAQIIPAYCDAMQSTECNVSGGVWMGGDFEGACRNCLGQSKKLWPERNFHPIRFSEFLTDDDLRVVESRMASIDAGSWLHCEEEGLPFGTWAKDILVNNYVVGDYRLIDNHERLGRAHLRNLLLLKIVYERLLAHVEPDRVVSNDSYYGMWAVLQNLCERKGIPFYSQWTGGRQGGWCYASNDAAMNLDFTKPWKRFSKMPLDAAQLGKVEQWLRGRTSGKEMILDTASLAAHHTDHFDLGRLDMNRPTALLAANVIWDLAALNKQVVFEDMIDWIARTIEWFSTRPQFQLIVKSHPAELNPSIPATNETVEKALQLKGVEIPGNVFLFSPKVDLTVYQLFPLIKAGLVHTTTVGIEMAAIGLPVITSARSPYRGFGFTLDPENQSNYFNDLEEILAGKRLLDPARQVDLAYKFILFYHFHYYTKIDIMDYRWGERPRLKVKKIQDLFPGNNKYLDYVVDSIVTGLPIISDERWPEES